MCSMLSIEYLIIPMRRAVKAYGDYRSKSTKYELEGSYDDMVHELRWPYHTPLFLSLVVVAVLVVLAQHSVKKN